MSSRRWLLVTGGMIVVVWTAWLLLAQQPWQTIATHWPITLTMAFGSIVAGATCEGGGAVAFPVFTKVLHIPPSDARWFALAIQSVGMTAAAATIFAMRKRVDRNALIFAGLGGAVGIVLGQISLAPYVKPVIVRVLFTALQCGFAIMLVISTRLPAGTIRTSSTPSRKHTYWVLLGTGVIGGLVSSLFGNGLDLVTFSVLVLLFRVDETVATPTTVVLMASNSLVGFAFGAATQQYSELVYAYWTAAIPIVVVGAPLGAIICRLLSRRAIVGMLVTLIAIELVSTVWLIPMTPQLSGVAIVGLSVFVGGYWLMSRCQLFWPDEAKEIKWADAQ